ncbi:MAG: NAD(P)-dependent oxidoreductase [Acidimicrobiia bacterium]|nr:NAD(P)-dependent oxidoreductase [Acidimicrobiia bacterium]
MQIGFIGLGTMGRHMARHLQEAGHQLTVHDVRRDAATEHLAAGAVWADSPRQIGEASEIVFTSLPGPPEVEAVALGPDGLLEGMATGSHWFDLSTNSPTLIRRLHETFAARGVAVYDAPVSGGPRGAESGRLALWIGGDEAGYERCREVISAIGDQPYYVGPIGAGAIAKLVHNCAGYTIQTALAEVFTMGVKAGVDPLVIFEAVRQGALGRSRTFERLADHFLPGEYEKPSFALRLAHKDVSLACALGREVGVPMRIANLTLEEMTEAINRGWGDWDSRSPMQLQTERAGVEVQVPRADIRAAIERNP